MGYVAFGAAVVGIFAGSFYLARWLARPPRSSATLSYFGVKLLIGCAWAFSIVPDYLALRQDGRSSSVVVDAVVAHTGPSKLAGRLLYTSFLVLSILIILANAKSQPVQRHPVLLTVALLPFVAVTLSTTLVGEHYLRAALVYPLAVFAVYRARPPLRVLAVAGWGVVLTAALSLYLGLTNQALGTNPPPPVGDKALIHQGLLAGPYPHSNTLGLLMGLGLPFVFLIRSRLVRLVGVPLVVLALLWSANRNAILAGAVVLAFLLLARIWPKSVNAAGVWCLIAFGFVVFTPITNSNDLEAYSQRGAIWHSILIYWDQHRLTGQGLNFFSDQAMTGSAFPKTAFSGHNLLMNQLATAGLLGFAAVALLLWCAYGRANRLKQDRPVAMAFLLAFLVSSWLQSVGAFSDLQEATYLTWLPLAVILFDGDALPGEPVGSVGVEPEHAVSGADHLRR